MAIGALSDSELVEQIGQMAPEVLGVLKKVPKRCRPRAAQALARLGVRTLGDLHSLTQRDLLRVPNFGRTSLRHLESAVGRSFAFPVPAPKNVTVERTLLARVCNAMRGCLDERCDHNLMGPVLAQLQRYL